MSSENNPTVVSQLKGKVAFFVFDTESVADPNLVAQVRFPGEEMEPAEAVTRYRRELMEENGSDFIPYTFQFPVAVAIAKVSSDYDLLDLVTLDSPQYRPHVITENFWRGWTSYNQPTFVSFNGRGFDMPLMELAAYRYGIGVPAWFNDMGRAYEQPRNRYNTSAHLDLQDLMVNFGATRFNGGLNLAARLVAKPGKMDVQGDMVQDMYEDGQIEAINDYCRCDVLDTYFVFLRSRVMTGKLSRDREQEIVAETRVWLEQRSDKSTAYQRYLEHWGEWSNPWAVVEASAYPE